MSRSRAMRSELWPAATSRSTSVSRAESFGTAAVVPDSPTAAVFAASFDEVPWASPCAACSCGCTCPTGSSKKCSRSGDCSARPVTVSVVTLSCRCSPDAHGIETVCGSRDAPSSGSRGAGGFCDPPPPPGLGLLDDRASVPLCSRGSVPPAGSRTPPCRHLWLHTHRSARRRARRRCHPVSPERLPLVPRTPLRC